MTKIGNCYGFPQTDESVHCNLQNDRDMSMFHGPYKVFANEANIVVYFLFSPLTEIAVRVKWKSNFALKDTTRHSAVQVSPGTPFTQTILREIPLKCALLMS